MELLLLSTSFLSLLAPTLGTQRSSIGALGTVVAKPTTPARNVLSSTVQRYLTVGDFESLNDILREISLPIDENPTITETVAGSTLTVDISNIVCTGLELGDVEMTWTSADPSTQSLNANVDLIDVDLNCRLDYDYQYLFFSGGGVADLLTSNNQIDATLQISPTNAAIDSCTAEINIDDLIFDGDGLGALGAALNLFEGSIRGRISEEMQSFFCDFIRDFEQPMLDGVNMFFEMLNPYLDEEANSVQTNPLAFEKNMNVPSDITLLNYQNPQTTFASIIDTLMGQVSDYFGQDNGDTLNINVILKEIMDEDGTMTVDLSDLLVLAGTTSTENGLIIFDDSSMIGDLELRLTRAKILGLDSFTRFDPLEQIGKYTLASNMRIDSIKIELDAVLEMTAPEGNAAVQESFVIDMIASDINLSAGLLLAMNLDQIGGLPLGSMLDLNNVLPCIVSAIYKLQLTSLLVESMTIEQPIVTGFESRGFQRIVSDSLDAMFTAFEPILSQALPNIIEKLALDFMDNAVGLVTDTNECPTVSASSNTSFIDFRDFFLPPDVASLFGGTGTQPYGDLASLVKDFIDTELLTVDPKTNLTGLAEMFIVPMTIEQSGVTGTFSMQDVVDFSGDIWLGEIRARLELKVGNIRVENLDSIGDPLFLLEPVRNEPHLLNNTVTLGVAPRPLRLGASLRVHIGAGDQLIHNEVDVSVEVDSASLILALLMKMLESRVLSFPLENLLEWNCWLATIPAPSLDRRGIRGQNDSISLALSEIDVIVQSMRFSVDCLNCSSPELLELSSLLSSPEASRDATQSAMNVVNFLLSQVEGEASLVQTQLDRMLIDAPRFCPHHPDYDPFATTTQYESLRPDNTSEANLAYLVGVLIVFACVIVVSIAIQCLVRCCVTSRHRKWVSSLSHDRAVAVFAEQQREREEERLVNEASRSMILSKQIPLLIRLFVPIVLMGNIALFLSGHFSKGGTVQISIQIGGQKVVFDNFYSFSIAQSGVELWKVGSKELAILMLLFSGVWPYTKQLITIALWLLPPRVVSVATRGSVLLWLDFLAKWSMIGGSFMIHYRFTSIIRPLTP
jgi:hypothetical protein